MRCFLVTVCLGAEHLCFIKTAESSRGVLTFTSRVSFSEARMAVFLHESGDLSCDHNTREHPGLRCITSERNLCSLGHHRRKPAAGRICALTESYLKEKCVIQKTQLHRCEWIFFFLSLKLVCVLWGSVRKEAQTRLQNGTGWRARFPSVGPCHVRVAACQRTLRPAAQPQ